MQFQVGIVLHDACIYRISLAFGTKSRTVCSFVWCGYGLDLRYTVCSTRVHAPPHNCSTDNRTAPSRTILEKYHPHRTDNRTAPYGSQKNINRTEAHRVISELETPHRSRRLFLECSLHPLSSQYGPGTPVSGYSPFFLFRCLLQFVVLKEQESSHSLFFQRCPI